ncbi:class I SAM-dependent methyltransferase [Pinibacter aurantiacus]|uniref:Class I SAM-dependent methyltransferase n=1 Tax=Pinibacter aurantiacus TaxID=2851599 RepID=A0A9E2S7M2_9BACT|nr:class I SAM-dependent methyltransferase [Pinibacter aurantiacus]MBV4356004.1 class I SAM-dependent methyltransferase [Pinibacter aurantiacus]
MEWIEILKCPITGKDVRALEPHEIESLNSKVAAGAVWQADGKVFSTPLTKGLITTDGAYIYPIINEIILLLKDLAVVDSQDKLLKETISADKQLVKNFYDEKGWTANEKGDYEDAVIFEDLRDVSKEYIKKCHDRVRRFLNPSGTYMLDAASGALQFPDYLQYSDNYKYRICVDFSFTALSEAKRKLGDKGICVLCDMTNMPFKDGKIDGFISLNTIYHIPKDEQVTAMKELYRVLAAKGKGVIVYEWFKHSPWMNVGLFPFRAAVFTKNRLKEAFNKVAGKGAPEKMLYFHAHPYEYFKKNLPFAFQLKVWRSISVPFMKYYIHAPLFGKQILNWLYNKEEREPEKCGLKGEYPIFVFEK